MIPDRNRLCRHLLMPTFLVLLSAGCAGPISLPTTTTTCRVIRVVDGDTIRVDMGGDIHTVRLIGVDTPETKHPTKPVQYFGREAAAFTKKWLHGKTVKLVVDPTGDTRDRYGRLLRHVYLDGDNFNARLIREGYAFAYKRFPFSQRSLFIRLEAEARKNALGLWGIR